MRWDEAFLTTFAPAAQAAQRNVYDDARLQKELDLRKAEKEQELNQRLAEKDREQKNFDRKFASDSEAQKALTAHQTKQLILHEAEINARVNDRSAFREDKAKDRDREEENYGFTLGSAAVKELPPEQIQAYAAKLTGKPREQWTPRERGMYAGADMEYRRLSAPTFDRKEEYQRDPTTGEVSGKTIRRVPVPGMTGLPDLEIGARRTGLMSAGLGDGLFADSAPNGRNFLGTPRDFTVPTAGKPSFTGTVNGAGFDEMKAAPGFDLLSPAEQAEAQARAGRMAAETARVKAAKEAADLAKAKEAARATLLPEKVEEERRIKAFDSSIRMGSGYGTGGIH